jgi:hypothetical protein
LSYKSRHKKQSYNYNKNRKMVDGRQ